MKKPLCLITIMLSVAIGAFAQTKPRDHWLTELQARDVPCAPINTIDGGVALAASLGLNPVIDAGGVPGVRNPITFSETPPAYQLPPPGLDEHDEEIRAWLTS